MSTRQQLTIVIFISNLFTLNLVIADPTMSSLKSSVRAINNASKASIRASRRNTKDNLQLGYGATNYNTKRTPKNSYKTTSNLNMRSKANSSSSIIMVLNKNSHVVSTGDKQGNWWEVSQNKKTGWVHSKYLMQRDLY